MPIKIVHQDDLLVVVEKPAGLSPAPSPRGAVPSLIDSASRAVFGSRPKPHQKLWLVDQIETQPGGLVVLAKDEKTRESLAEQFRRGRVHRISTALVHEPEGGIPDRGTHRTTLAEYPDGRIESLPPEAFNTGRGRAAVATTHYRVVDRGSGHAMLRLRLGTARRGQARVHCAELGMPIVGDARLGPDRHPKTPLALITTELGFTHPGTRQTVRYTVPPPAAFWRLLGKEAPAHAERAAEDRPGDRGWEHVAPWYEQLLEGGASDHHERTVLPGVERLLDDVDGARVLDIACGQGALAERLLAAGASVVGIDASKTLIDAAADRLPKAEFVVGDARELKTGLGELAGTPFDAACCVLAAMNIEPIAPVFSGTAELLRPDGTLVLVVLHPAFRQPGSTDWAWETREDERGMATVQWRRVRSYLSLSTSEIVMNPGEAASGADPVVTLTHHRPVSAYVTALAQAGFAIDALEEWVSHRRSEPGPRAEAENTARAEIPMFLAIRARRLAATAGEADSGPEAIEAAEPGATTPEDQSHG
ncbi:MAG: methyltransferase domain-containing protein [Planctomycetota bacterium]